MSTESKYQLLAGELAEAIRSGRLAAGSQLQSVRKAMQHHGVSLATVLNAYRVLEERGLIAARAKSGYFVLGKENPRPVARDEPLRAAPNPAIAAAAAIGGSNYPDVELFPTQRLHRLSASVLRRHQYLATRRPGGLGFPKLRQEIARRSADVGSFLRAEELFITNGATEALMLAIRGVALPGDSVALQTPANPLFLTLLAHLHISVVEVPGCAQEFSLQALKDTVAKHPKVRAFLLVPNFHHPTGALLSVADKRALLSYAEQARLALIEVDIYGDLQHEGPRPPPLKAFDTSGAVIYLTSYSKTIAPGLNIGWMAAGRWHREIETMKLTATVATPELPQLVLFEFLSRGSHIPHYRRLRQLLRERTLLAGAALTRALPAGRWSLPAGGYFLWLELPRNVDAARLLEQPGPARPGISAGHRFSSQRSYDHCVRINTSLAGPAVVVDLAKAVNRA